MMQQWPMWRINNGRERKKNVASFLFCNIILMYHNNYLSTAQSDIAIINNFCGTSWGDASENCNDRQHCPHGSDDECSNWQHTCFADTTCDASKGQGLPPSGVSAPSLSNTNSNGLSYEDRANTRFCQSQTITECTIDLWCGDRGGCDSGMICAYSDCHYHDLLKNEEETSTQNALSTQQQLLIGVGENDPIRNHACGSTWEDASSKCSVWCLGEESICPKGQKCFSDTTCYSNVGLVPTVTPTTSYPTTRPPTVRADPSNFRYCGKAWAETECSIEGHCPTGLECKGEEVCYTIQRCNIHDMTKRPTPPPSSSPTIPFDHQMYCGKTYDHAANNCSFETNCVSDDNCPTGSKCFEELPDQCNAFFIEHPELRPTERPTDPTMSPSTMQPVSKSPTNYYNPRNMRFCGLTWDTTICSLDTHCPDDECPSGMMCFTMSHCNIHDISIAPTNNPTLPPFVRPTEPTLSPSTAAPISKAPTIRDDPRNMRFCGVQLDKTVCSRQKHCPDGNECKTGETCFTIPGCNIHDMADEPTNNPTLSSPILPRDHTSNAMFCGKDITDALINCSLETHCSSTKESCPTGTTCLLTPPGRGCNAHDMHNYPTTTSPSPTRIKTPTVSYSNFCGKTFVDAIARCSLDTQCTLEVGSCPDGENCYIDLSGHCYAFDMYPLPDSSVTTSSPITRTSVPTTPKPISLRTKRPTYLPTPLPTSQITIPKIPRPHYLFAGQSNMEGYVDINCFNATMDILFDATRTETQILSDLKQHYYSYPSNPSTSSERYDFMAEYLLNLKGEGMLSKSIRQSQKDISCSYYQLDRRENSNPAETIVLDQPLSPNSCGKYSGFGPELMFGHVMEQLYYGPKGISFAIDKIVAGGSEIEYHWSKDIGDSNHGKFWDDLVLRVQNISIAKDYWAGIVWFQGENEAFRAANSTAARYSDEERIEIEAKVGQYQQNLVEFVRDIRQEVYDVDMSRYESPGDIPFAIIQIGCWIVDDLPDYGPSIFEAQQAVADNDDKIVLVDTYNSLSCHYHYDDTSMLIIGHRLAVQLLTVLKEPTTNKPSRPSTTTITTSEPSTTPSGEGTSLWCGHSQSDANRNCGENSYTCVVDGVSCPNSNLECFQVADELCGSDSTLDVEGVSRTRRPTPNPTVRTVKPSNMPTKIKPAQYANQKPKPTTQPSTTQPVADDEIKESGTEQPTMKPVINNSPSAPTADSILSSILSTKKQPTTLPDETPHPTSSPTDSKPLTESSIQSTAQDTADIQVDDKPSATETTDVSSRRKFYCISKLDNISEDCTDAVECSIDHACPAGYFCMEYDCKRRPPHSSLDLCPFQFVGNHTKDEDCKSYYECDEEGHLGVGHTHTCQEGYNFEKSHGTCIVEHLVDSRCYQIISSKPTTNANAPVNKFPTLLPTQSQSDEAKTLTTITDAPSHTPGKVPSTPVKLWDEKEFDLSKWYTYAGGGKRVYPNLFLKTILSALLFSFTLW